MLQIISTDKISGQLSMHSKKCTKHARKPGSMSKNLQKKCAVKTKTAHIHTHRVFRVWNYCTPDIEKIFHILKEIKQKLGKIKEQQNNHTDLKTRAFKDEKNNYI